MASVLASELLSRLRQATDTEGDGHVTDAELYRALTSAVSDTWDQILINGIGTEGVKWVTLAVTSGTQEYPRSSSIWTPSAGGSAAALTDFYQVSRVLVNESDGTRRPLPRINPSEQYCHRAPTVSGTVRLYYFPTAPAWTTGSESFDGINGWEEHTVQTAAIFVKAKKQDDTGQYRARKRELEERMKVMANRNRDEPPRIVRRANRVYRGYAIPYTTGIMGWDLRGANLELFA